MPQASFSEKFCEAVACVRREGSRCEETVAAIKRPIAAPAWTRYGTRPSLRHLCVLPTVRAAGGGFRRRRGALRAGRCTLGRIFRLTDAARPRTWRYVIAHGMPDKVHVTNYKKNWRKQKSTPRRDQNPQAKAPPTRDTSVIIDEVGFRLSSENPPGSAPL